MRAELRLPDHGSANHMNPVTMDSRVSLPALGARPAHGCLKQSKVHLPLMLQGGISKEALAQAGSLGNIWPPQFPVGQQHWKMAQRGRRHSGPFPQMLLSTVHSSILNQSQTLWKNYGPSQDPVRPTEAVRASGSIAYPRDGSISVFRPKENSGKSAGFRAFSHTDQMEAVPGDIISHPHPPVDSLAPCLGMHRHHGCPAHLSLLPALLPLASEQASVSQMPQ